MIIVYSAFISGAIAAIGNEVGRTSLAIIVIADKPHGFATRSRDQAQPYYCG
ncbi:hypothetical protein [Devosia sp.]|uniref:hypothetical protein n=1 Tax=Devosia sp. TaxID=1871048 RepID=UPI001B254641|nr:hypothetical protein [Devosia sp.]MBO9591116.1 hypothetical protein [Devosia sp.]